MGDSFKTIHIKDLEVREEISNEASLVVIDSSDGKITPWSSVLNLIKTKLASWAYNTLTTTDKTLPGAIEEVHKEVNEFNTKIDNYIKFVSVTLNEISLKANYDGTFYNGIPSYSGYTPYVVIPSNSNASDVCWMAAFVNSVTEICVKLKNTSSVTKTFKPIVDVIYVKNL